MNGLFRPIAIVGWLLPATPAFAHMPVEGVGGFIGGLLHPILVPAHALGLLALGLFIGQQRERRIAMLIFAAALAAGLVAIAFAVGPTGANGILLTNTALLGVIVAAAWAPPRAVGGLVAAISGVALALDSPPDAISIAEGNRMLVGTALGACAALAAVVTAGSLVKFHWQQLGVRIIGSWIAASAILVLAAALMR